MIISVTEEHIKKGVKASYRTCPIALALEDAGFDSPKVSVASYWYQDAKRLNLPLKVQKFIKDFDNGKKVRPFSFRTKKYG